MGEYALASILQRVFYFLGMRAEAALVNVDVFLDSAGDTHVSVSYAFK
jgi:hypothetical protein